MGLKSGILYTCGVKKNKTMRKENKDTGNEQHIFFHVSPMLHV